MGRRGEGWGGGRGDEREWVTTLREGREEGGVGRQGVGCLD